MANPGNHLVLKYLISKQGEVESALFSWRKFSSWLFRNYFYRTLSGHYSDILTSVSSILTGHLSDIYRTFYKPHT